VSEVGRAIEIFTALRSVRTATSTLVDRRVALG
jgi:hypothetical protein